MVTGGHEGPGVRVFPKNSHPRGVTLLSSSSRTSKDLLLYKNSQIALTPSSSI